MHRIHKILSRVEYDEVYLKELLNEANTPDEICAALTIIVDENWDSDDGFGPYENLFNGHVERAIERIFTIIAETSEASGAIGINEVKYMLYRLVCDYIAKRRAEIYRGYEEYCPFGDKTMPSWNWPVINDAPSEGIFNDGGFRAFSILKMFGYTVGKSAGWNPVKRQEFLSDFMELALPVSALEIFGSEYGNPMSTTRLRGVANLLANNCGLRMRSNPDRYQHAIEDWKDDLEFLKKKYYEGHGLKFHPWPAPQV